jgi:hypothetical protein
MTEKVMTMALLMLAAVIAKINGTGVNIPNILAGIGMLRMFTPAPLN